MSIVTEIRRLQAAKADIKTAIEGKGVTVPSTEKIDAYADYIEAIPQGGGGRESYEDDVMFIDYEGTVLYRYTKEEFLALSEMPSNPSHEGLTAQGWNWDLQDAQDYVSDCGCLVIGQMYATSDGKTRYYITLDDPQLLSPTFYVPSNSVIDWGDGTTTTSGSIPKISHTYDSTGDYVVAIQIPNNGNPPYLNTEADVARDYSRFVRSIRIGGTTGGTLIMAFARYFFNLKDITIPLNITLFNSGAIFNDCHSLNALVLPKNMALTGNFSFKNCTSLRVISINKLATFGQTSFQYCSCLEIVNLPPSITKTISAMFSPCENLRRVTIPSGITTLEASTFSNCFGLSSVKLPNTLTTIESYAFAGVTQLQKITLPSSLESIKQRAFQGALLKELTIPASVDTIEMYAFYQCAWLLEVHVLATTPPTAGSGIFLQAPLKKIYVPSGTLSAYQSASGWSTYANLMEEE